MNALSSSILTLKVPPLHPTPPEFRHFKTPNMCHQHPDSISTKPNSSFSTKTSSNQTLSFKNLQSLVPFTNISRSSSPLIHRNLASGYAAALVDIAPSNGTTILQAIRKNVQRLLKVLNQNEQIRSVLANPFVGEKKKGQAMKELAKRAKFNRLLVGLLKMLIERNKVMMVRDVLMEFEWIYDELSGVKLVFASFTKKIKESKLFKIC